MPSGQIVFQVVIYKRGNSFEIPLRSILSPTYVSIEALGTSLHYWVKVLGISLSDQTASEGIVVSVPIGKGKVF
jgi:hypothetical protein